MYRPIRSHSHAIWPKCPQVTLSHKNCKEHALGACTVSAANKWTTENINIGHNFGAIRATEWSLQQSHSHNSQQKAQLSLGWADRSWCSKGSKCECLLVTNSNLGLISHCFWNTTYRLAEIAHTNLQSHPKSIIFISSERVYAIFY